MDQEKGATTFGYPFLVQLKPLLKPVVHIKAPKKYRHQKGVIPDHLSWMFRHDLPVFLALVDKEEMAISLYSLAPVWFLYHDSENCPDCSSLRLVPRIDGSDSGPVGPPRRLGKVSSSPESYEYEVDLGFPIASWSVKETARRQDLLKEQACLRRCIDYDFRNLVFLRADLPHFYWMAETDREKEGPLPAFSFHEAPRDPDRLKNMFSFLGPALLPLVLRYREDNRPEVLKTLRYLFREIPADTIPPEIRKSLPEVFGREGRP